MHHENFGVGTYILVEHRWLAMVGLDTALVSSYRVSMVTMLQTEAVLSQFTMQVFGVQSVYLFGKEKSRS